MATTPALAALGAAAAKWFEEIDDRGVFITDDRLIVRRRRAILGVAALLAIVSVALVPRQHPAPFQQPPEMRDR